MEGWLEALIGLVAGAAAVYRFAWSRGFKAAERSLNDTALRKRFELLYAPMAALFLKTPVTSSRATLAPYLSQRLKRVWSDLRRGEVARAFRAVNDRRSTKETAEIEFGGSFPLGDINRILAGNEAYADEELLNLVASADRARYELAHQGSPEDGSLTDEELELFRHILTTRSKLAATFSPEA